MDLIYRRLRPDEALLYRQIRLECLKNYPSHFGSVYAEQKARPKLSFELNIETQHPDKFIMGALSDDQLVGICGFSRESSVREKHRGWIIQMYVDPAHQGQGIGQSLLGATIEEAFKIPGILQIELGVYATGQAAERIYEKKGFSVFGVRKNAIRDKEIFLDEKMMVLFRPS